MEKIKKLIENKGVETKPQTEVPKGEQSMFWWAEELTLSGSTVNTGIMETIPKGKRLVVLGFDVASRDGVDSKFSLLKNSKYVFETVLESHGSKERSWETFPKGSMIIRSENNFVRKIWNYDTADHTYNINVLAIIVENE